MSLTTISFKCKADGYYYAKPVSGRVWVTVTTEGSKKATKFTIKKTETTIGRSSACDIYIPKDDHLSRSHAMIVVEHNVPYM